MKLVVVRKIVLSLIASWLSLVMFTDFIVVPTVFRTLSNRFEAGELGMKVFAALGAYEAVVAVLLFLTARVVFKRFRTKRAGFLFLFATTLLTFALLGRFYITPELTKINQDKYTLDEQSSEYQKLQSRHNFLHSFYVKLDGTKMLFLIAGLLGSFRSSRFDQDKVFTINQRRKL